MALLDLSVVIEPFLRDDGAIFWEDGRGVADAAFITRNEGILLLRDPEFPHLHVRQPRAGNSRRAASDELGRHVA